jgi:hypothetical protein
MRQGLCSDLPDDYLNGEAVRSCAYTIDSIEGTEVTTIEGLGRGGLHRLQQAWIDLQVPQCRLLPTWLHHGGGCVACSAAKAERSRDRRVDHQYLPLRDLFPYQTSNSCVSRLMT